MRHTLLTLAILLFGVISGYAQIVTVSFTGQDAKNQTIPLNRVIVTNLTQNWQEVLYYPDTILILGSTGVNDVESIGEFLLSQNVPNPFDGTTDFVLQLPEAGKVSLEVYDMIGKIITSYHGKLPIGIHSFRVMLNTSQSYLLTARCGNHTSTIKMVNSGNAGENTIQHLGENFSYQLSMPLKSNKGSLNKPFALGDNMIYQAYAVINGQEYPSQSIEQRQIYSETVTFNFNATAIFLPQVYTKTIEKIYEEDWIGVDDTGCGDDSDSTRGTQFVEHVPEAAEEGRQLPVVQHQRRGQALLTPMGRRPGVDQRTEHHEGSEPHGGRQREHRAHLVSCAQRAD